MRLIARASGWNQSKRRIWKNVALPSHTAKTPCVGIMGNEMLSPLQKTSPVALVMPRLKFSATTRASRQGFDTSYQRSSLLDFGPLPTCRFFSSDDSESKEAAADTIEVASDTISAQDRGGFSESWIKQKDKLVAKKIGKLKEKDWMEAQELLNTFRTNPNINKTGQERAELAFDIMDRMSGDPKGQHEALEEGDRIPTYENLG
eukprot:CAMPEP_0168729352 /NCGR_PEP_ID=MMETSP0724-20121128/6155_1 /TAXON_ID=265536 /ORGANISM="Amphiprora sp., Strain CCMP467" /LENGTH=203 /DNA_ID=CAMNT_0008776225 /DNA_START=32 /DNA_END=640 /DNA_ORIENTATION=-